jgi:nitroreductase
MEKYEPVTLPASVSLNEIESKKNVQKYYDFIRTRHSIREFSNREVSKDIIETALYAAGRAPSGANHQPWHFVCVNDPSTKSKIRIAAEQEEQAFYAGKAGQEWLNDLKKIGTDANKPFLEVAPWLIAIFVERSWQDKKGGKTQKLLHDRISGNRYRFSDKCTACCGLATLTHTPSPMKFLNEILDQPKNHRPFLLLVVGHPAEKATIPAASTKKKSIEEIATFI